MKSNILWSVIAVAGMVLVSTGAAQAGGAAGQIAPLTTFLMCHGISGDDQGVIVDVYTNELGDSPMLNVRIGSAALGCTQVRLATAGGTLAANEISPPAGSSFYLKCYNVSVPRSSSTSAAGGLVGGFNVTDTFEPVASGGEAVVVTSPRVLCGPATFSQ